MVLGENGRQHRGRVIVVGADNEYIPSILGYETATTMDEALRMAKRALLLLHDYVFESAR